MKPNVTEGVPSSLSGVDFIECPTCAARLIFSRRPVPPIDSNGFEIYSFKCDQCGADLVGIIDPFDDQLLLSKLER
jgi:DNA-directed RNA polymerase subunit RPC12/RpoP